jgi:hypothetical protein
MDAGHDGPESGDALSGAVGVGDRPRWITDPLGYAWQKTWSGLTSRFASAICQREQLPEQSRRSHRPVEPVKYVHWQKDDAWLRYLEEYSAYWNQGETPDDLIEHLKDLSLDLTGGPVPGASGDQQRGD